MELLGSLGLGGPVFVAGSLAWSRPVSGWSSCMVVTSVLTSLATSVSDVDAGEHSGGDVVSDANGVSNAGWCKLSTSAFFDVSADAPKACSCDSGSDTCDSGSLPAPG